jgi:hypothetical protein
MDLPQYMERKAGLGGPIGSDVGCLVRGIIHSEHYHAEGTVGEH